MAKLDIKLFEDFRGSGLKDCVEQGYTPLFMPQVARARIDLDNLNKNLWYQEIITPSIGLTGRTRRGNPVVVVAHIPTYLSNPKNLIEKSSDELHKYHSLRFQQNEFNEIIDRDRLEDEQGNRLVWVISYEEVKNFLDKSRKTKEIKKMIKAKSIEEANKIGEKIIGMTLEEAITHPLTIPCLGGRKNAEEYLERHRKIYSKNKIGIWYDPIRLGHVDNLNNGGPLGDLLMFGGHEIGGIFTSHYRPDHEPSFLGTMLKD